ncbi:hypothetical protein F5887DRAFT_996708, partial [Amanita rubescens]
NTVASKIPTETLCDIFLLLCDGPIALHELRNISRSHEFPWAVGQVCRHWRWAFVYYPALWSALSFEEPQPEIRDLSVTYVAEMNRRAEIYLKRSKQQPLTLLVSVPGPTINDKIYSPIWGMLLSCSDRWKWADLDIENQSLINGLVERRKKMSILESLTIVIYDIQDHKYGTAFEIAPHLTQLNLNYDNTRDAACGTLERWPFPWAQLTKLTIDQPYLEFANSDALRSFLLQFQNVEELHFDVFFVDVDSDIPECPAVRFSRLKLFGISLAVSWMLSFFEAPILEHLSVCDGFEDMNDHNHVEEILSFVQRSSCRIRRLSLQDCTADVAQNIMEVLDHVEGLSVEPYFDVQPGYAHCIIRDIADSGGICPNLQLLEVSCCPGYFDDVVLAATCVLSARCTESRSRRSIVPLKKLIITVDWDGCNCGHCSALNKASGAIDTALKHMCLHPSFSVFSLDSDRWGRTLTVHASIAGAQVDLTIHYPDDPNAYQYYSEQSCRHISILESERTQE